MANGKTNYGIIIWEYNQSLQFTANGDVEFAWSGSRKGSISTATALFHQAGLTYSVLMAFW